MGPWFKVAEQWVVGVSFSRKGSYCARPLACGWSESLTCGKGIFNILGQDGERFGAEERSGFPRAPVITPRGLRLSVDSTPTHLPSQTRSFLL